MTTMTGLDRMAPIQSKFANITGLLVVTAASAPAGAGGELRDAVRGRGSEFLVLRVLDDVAVRLDRAGDLPSGLVERGEPRKRRQAERFVTVRTRPRLLVRAHRPGHVGLLFPTAT